MKSLLERSENTVVDVAYDLSSPIFNTKPDGFILDLDNIEEHYFAKMETDQWRRIRPENIAYKIPMEQKVMTFDGRVFCYEFINSEMVWQYLYSATPEASICHSQNRLRLGINIKPYGSITMDR